MSYQSHSSYPSYPSLRLLEKNMTPYSLGLVFAGGAALCWTFSATAFSRSSGMVGSLPVNLIRLVLASVFFALYGGLTRGLFLPLDATAHAWFWLSLSGFIGFFLGDLFLFRSFRELGARLSMLVMSLAPLIAAVAGWLWFGERMNRLDIAGMLVTIAGVAWVVLERRIDSAGSSKRISIKGVAFAFLGAAGQGIGLVMGRWGMKDPLGVAPDYDPFAATQIRAFTGLAAFIVLVLLLRRMNMVLAPLKRPNALAIIAFGSLLGPFLGVAFLMRAVQMIPSGVAQTLTATVPVLIIPLAVLLDKEHVTWRAVFGTLVTVAGVAMLCL